MMPNQCASGKKSAVGLSMLLQVEFFHFYMAGRHILGGWEHVLKVRENSQSWVESIALEVKSEVWKNIGSCVE